MEKPVQKLQPNQKQTVRLDPKIREDLAPIKLYYCTIWEGKINDDGKAIITEEMRYNVMKLSKVKGLDLKTTWVKAGTFSHRHRTEVPDPEQIIHRNVYLDKVPTGEWLIVLDSDELLLGALDNIPMILRIMNANENIDYAMISELLPNGELKLRPRLIRKRDGLKYGGPNSKHDYIAYERVKKHPHYAHGECLTYADHVENCIETINYIDVAAENRSWMLDFLIFFHIKNGYAMEIYANTQYFEIPKNMVQIEEDRWAFHTHEEGGLRIQCQGSETGHCQINVRTLEYPIETGKQYTKENFPGNEDKYNAYKEIVRD